MSNSGIPIVESLPRFGKSIVGAFMPTPDIPSQELPTRGDPANDVPKQTEQVATRDQQQRVALAASGITSTQNERDLLGGALGRRSASRALLGGR